MSWLQRLWYRVMYQPQEPEIADPIQRQISDIQVNLRKVEKHLAKIASCVQVSSRQAGHGDPVSLSTKHWND